MAAAENVPTKLPADVQAVLAVYQQRGEVANEEMFASASKPLGLSEEDLRFKSPVGVAGRKHSLAKRRLRWAQQTLKHLGLLERTPGQRGVWRLRSASENELTPAQTGMTLLAFSTDLGLCLWSSCEALARIEEPVALVLTSPPYPIAKGRLYGRWTSAQLIDFLCRSIEPLLTKMLPGGSLALNLTNDSFLPGSPARSTYLEELTLALTQRLGLHLMDRIVWRGTKPPGPVRWASLTRQQLCVAYEPVLWFALDPHRCFADNRRVLQPHTDRHARLLQAGGEKRSVTYQDGAHRLRAGVSFARLTAGTIPKNVLDIGQNSAEIAALRRVARAADLPQHGALMPLRLARFLIDFLSRPDDLVVDPFGGWGTTARAAQDAGRRWITTELHAEYVAAQALRMADCSGFRSNVPTLLPGALFARAR